jgi:hypothetical protein
MKKSVMLAAFAALSLATGTAMAQEVDAQFLPKNAVPRAVHQNNAGAPMSPNYSVQTRQLTPAPDGSDGGGN